MFSWFRTATETEPAAGEANPEDLRRAAFIQQKTQLGAYFANRLSDPDEDHDAARRRYASVRDEMIATLDLVEDEFSRGVAAHQFIKMCKAANDEVIARALLICVRDKFVREKTMKIFPNYGRAATPRETPGMDRCLRWAR